MGPARRLIVAVEGLPLGTLWLGLSAALGIGALYVAWHVAAGPEAQPFRQFSADEPLFLTADGRAHAVVVLLIAYLLAVHRYESRHWRIDLERLQPLTRLSPEEFEGMLGRLGAVGRGALLGHVGAGVLVGLAIVPAASEDPAFVLHVESWNAHLGWVALSNGLLFGLMGRSVYADRLERRMRARVVQEIAKIDLLDRRSLAPFARQGLRNAFYWAAGSSLASLLVFNVSRAWPIAVLLAGTLLLATLALLGPAWGVHRRLREAKRSELLRVRARIERVKEAALAPAGGAGEAALLPGLLAYEARIESVGEWPFDTPTLLRFGGLLLLATGSWLGGALAERLLGLFLA
jgi:hypothetical protein